MAHRPDLIILISKNLHNYITCTQLPLSKVAITDDKFIARHEIIINSGNILFPQNTSWNDKIWDLSNNGKEARIVRIFIRKYEGRYDICLSDVILFTPQ